MRPVRQAECRMQRAGGFGNVIDIFGGAVTCLCAESWRSDACIGPLMVSLASKVVVSISGLLR